MVINKMAELYTCQEDFRAKDGQSAQQRSNSYTDTLGEVTIFRKRILIDVRSFTFSVQ